MQNQAWQSYYVAPIISMMLYDAQLPEELYDCMATMMDLISI
jgi:hypothetical protein